MFSKLSGGDGGVEVYVGRQGVPLGRRGLCSVVSIVGGMVSILVTWLISFVMFTFASGVSCCWVLGAMMWSLARRLRSVALLHNVLRSLWNVLSSSGV